MGFEILPQALDEGAALSPVLHGETAFPNEDLSDEAALKIVLQDINISLRYLQGKMLPSEWNMIDDLYRAFVNPRTWPNSNIPRANLSMPVVMEAIETLLPQTHMAFFSDSQPFLLDAAGKTSAEAARAMAKLGKWGFKVADAKEELRKTQKSCFQYGMGIIKWGWRTETVKRKIYKRHSNNVDVESEDEVHEIAFPTVEWVDLRNLLVDAGTRCHDIRTSKHRTYQKFIDADQLDDMRKDGTYSNIPTREQLSLILTELSEPATESMQGNKQNTWRENQAELQERATSVDPLRQPLELLEYETEDRIITVLQRKIVIRNEPNEEGCHYFSCSFIDVLNAFYGFGVSKLIEGEQRLQAGVANAMVDSYALTLNPVWQRKGGIGAKSQNITVAPGKVVNDSGELIPLEVKSVTAEALQAIQASEARAARRVGSNSGDQMPTQAMRTAEGVNQFTSGIQIKLQYFVDTFANLVFIPLVEKFIYLCKENLTPQQIQTILTDEEGQEFQGDILDVYNGKFTVDVLSSTKVAGRRAMQALIPLLLNLFGQPALAQLLQNQGEKIQLSEFFNEVFDVTGWPSVELIVPMTPEDIQRMQAQNPAVINAQAKSTQMDKAQHNALELQQAHGEAQAGVAVIKHVLQGSEAEAQRQHEINMQAKPLADEAPKE